LVASWSCLRGVETLQPNSHPEAEAVSVLQHFWYYFFFISFQEMGWRQRFPPEHALDDSTLPAQVSKEAEGL